MCLLCVDGRFSHIWSQFIWVISTPTVPYNTSLVWYAHFEMYSYEEMNTSIILLGCSGSLLCSRGTQHTYIHNIIYIIIIHTHNYTCTHIATYIPTYIRTHFANFIYSCNEVRCTIM